MKHFDITVVESPYNPKTPRLSYENGCCCRFVGNGDPKSWEDLCLGHSCDVCQSWKNWFDELSRNMRYARACARDCILRGESPYLSHLLLTQEGILDDTIPEERSLGMEMGFVFHEVASLTAVYTDLGISKGMEAGIEDAKARFCPIEYRKLGGIWNAAY